MSKRQSNLKKIFFYLIPAILFFFLTLLGFPNLPDPDLKVQASVNGSIIKETAVWENIVAVNTFAVNNPFGPIFVAIGGKLDLPTYEICFREIPTTFNDVNFSSIESKVSLDFNDVKVLTYGIKNCFELPVDKPNHFVQWNSTVIFSISDKVRPPDSIFSGVEREISVKPNHTNFLILYFGILIGYFSLLVLVIDVWEKSKS